MKNAHTNIAKIYLSDYFGRSLSAFVHKAWQKLKNDNDLAVIANSD